ncbi:putative NAD-dependent protein-ADP-ribosyltransferase YbiA (DUF1768 family) [Actinoplanes lutulentus]|uniref:Putative NAD-dependent protein-ADP-ribosyltransferase YbiA (DUF1768 family) n=1 Tax=Actinoplanes lutulentus TaxID=1287878 RepID=A0A327YZX2_9ACTN|nr:NADAR family protein [Actinoplanes lutulentus]MBB2943593.1 putative NAD-dependent protein-ADP-ribosyltransferase YbiA (DUF1768 family) [Actinoplanes lutulentus]RAK27458.1 putative NAD-dependent protein-ADP-ribosyltransferase YbiA (DUF1768 family) [Actinoplanes lutulentus]
MPDTTPTSRNVEDDVVRGRQRLIFVRDQDRYVLTTLGVYADGVVAWRWTTTDFDGLGAAFGDGTLTLAPPEGARIIIEGTATGPARLESWLTPELVIGDLADEVDRLNERPDSSRRAYEAFLDYAEAPAAAGLEAARAAYLAIPEHRRIYFLGDMDHNDVPARILLAEPGERIPARRPGTELTVTEASRESALDYFRRQRPAEAQWAARQSADGPATTPPMTVSHTVYPQGWPDPPGIEVLQNDYPAIVVHRGREYPSVTHAYWALSTSDDAAHDRIVAAGRGRDAASLGAEAPRRDDWTAARLAVMGVLLRDKFRRHPAIAATLLSTGEHRILYGTGDARYWSRGGRSGTNWVGRLLEVIRSELAAEAAGIL